MQLIILNYFSIISTECLFYNVTFTYVLIKQYTTGFFAHISHIFFVRNLFWYIPFCFRFKRHHKMIEKVSSHFGCRLVINKTPSPVFVQDVSNMHISVLTNLHSSILMSYSKFFICLSMYSFSVCTDPTMMFFHKTVQVWILFSLI